MKSNTPDKNRFLEEKLRNISEESFDDTTLEIFRFQYQNNTLYQSFCNSVNKTPSQINQIDQIPFLPIQFFKSHIIKIGDFNEEKIFESSGTSNTINSKHYVKNLGLYESNFIKCFSQFYGNPSDWCILGLLPSYLERNNSSLVYMVEKLIHLSQHNLSGFFLNDIEHLKHTLLELETNKQKTLLIGVTFALLDFAELHPMPLQHTTIMETGGMKGKREEVTREEVHRILKDAFNLNSIHSEYGMTELMSQAYSNGDGIFICPPPMKILIRAEDDPLHLFTAEKISNNVSGAINIIDLANLYSCSFIATDDAGKLYPNGNFEILGRLDNSDIRGCSLLTID